MVDTLLSDCCAPFYLKLVISRGNLRHSGERAAPDDRVQTVLQSGAGS